ncbi:MAG: hypothetical protein LQ351_003374 [Letrouitia transgressa]|nr:MAG: hypothetical protein LQ351_003374 [Letrouitia transgressa]
MASSIQPGTSSIPAYKTNFLQSCLSANVLTFGTYTLKSGRNLKNPLTSSTLDLSIPLLFFPQSLPPTLIPLVPSFLRTPPFQNRTFFLVIDDVITAGTAMRESVDLVAKAGGNIVGFVVAVDRMEKIPGPREREEGVDDGKPRMSAMGQIKREYGVSTASIVTLDDLIAILRDKGDDGDMKRLEEYRDTYLATD